MQPAVAYSTNEHINQSETSLLSAMNAQMSPRCSLGLRWGGSAEHDEYADPHEMCSAVFKEVHIYFLLFVVAFKLKGIQTAECTAPRSLSLFYNCLPTKSKITIKHLFQTSCINVLMLLNFLQCGYVTEIFQQMVHPKSKTTKQQMRLSPPLFQ